MLKLWVFRFCLLPYHCIYLSKFYKLLFCFFRNKRFTVLFIFNLAVSDRSFENLLSARFGNKETKHVRLIFVRNNPLFENYDGTLCFNIQPAHGKMEFRLCLQISLYTWMNIVRERPTMIANKRINHNVQFHI